MLRDTESVPLAERVEAFFEREVKPHLLDAWIDTQKRDPKDGQVATRRRVRSKRSKPTSGASSRTSCRCWRR